MKNINGKECTAHKVQITDYFEGVIHIPNEMDAMDLKALTQQANQIFKMSQSFIPDEPIEQKMEKYDDNRETFVEQYKSGKLHHQPIKQNNKKGKGVIWTAEEVETLKELRKTNTRKQIAKKMGIPLQRVISKLKYMSTKARKAPAKKQRGWTDEELERVKNLHINGMATNDIAKTMKCEYMRIYHKLVNMGYTPRTIKK